jgi:hypothetical protein
MTELTLRPAASADDARGIGSMALTDTILTIASADMLTLLRFPSATVPKNATINSAVLQAYFFNSNYDSGALTVAGIAADNQAAFVSTDTSPTWTTANVSVSLSNVMTSGNGFYAIATVTGIVQEIVNRSGWASGNAIALGMHSLSSGELRIYSWDYSDHTYAPKLIIDYVDATGAAKRLLHHSAAPFTTYNLFNTIHHV